MADPRVIPRAEHAISRRDIDPDALKVLYRLRQFEHTAYLVGGSVRDLLIGRRPKDFDIGTSAHPYQVKKLFRNCWIIGRRFRLAHVRFGQKVVEVATFRRQVQPGEEVVHDGVPAPDPSTTEGAHLIHHDNTFGTPEEDAFRRDFTINALFYDIATFSIIDYVNGLDDLRAGIVRSIGDPFVRFREDPVRMLRAVAFAARLNFVIDPPILEAIRELRGEIARASAPRLLEEYYKILRGGYAEKTFRSLAELGLLEPISAELHKGAGDALWQSLSELDTFRHRHAQEGQQSVVPETFTNALLLGSLIVPLGFNALPGNNGDQFAGARLGNLPVGRRDVERLRQMLGLQRRLRDVGASTRAQRGIAHRSVFREALCWMEIHGHTPELVEHWNVVATHASHAPHGTHAAASDEPNGNVADTPPFRKRRRRRRRRYRPTST